VKIGSNTHLIPTGNLGKEIGDMVSHKHNCIFIHIPKTAGTSIELKLGLFEKVQPNVQDHRSIREIEPLPVYGFLGARSIEDIKFAFFRFKHHRLKGREYVTPEQYNSYFKFTFIRNTWARVFSMYKAFMRNKNFKKMYDVQDNCSFHDFVASYLYIRQFRPQLFWLTDSMGQIPMDYIGRFENLHKDFDHIADAIHLEDSNLPRTMIGDGSCYTDFYDPQTKDRVYKRYIDEINLFGFNFGE
jgi:hypothetical protein